MKILITHLGQWHRGDEKANTVLSRRTAKDIQDFNDVVSSQFKHAHYILLRLKLNPQLILIEESLYSDLMPETVPNYKPNCAFSRELFPEGLPKKLENLKLEQRAFIFDCGAARVLFYLGQLPRIHKSVRNQATSESLDNSIAEHKKRLVEATTSEEKNNALVNHLGFAYPKREAELLFCVKAAAESYRSTHQTIECLVHYGANHDFKEAITRFKDPELEFAGEIIAAPADYQENRNCFAEWSTRNNSLLTSFTLTEQANRPLAPTKQLAIDTNSSQSTIFDVNAKPALINKSYPSIKSPTQNGILFFLPALTWEKVVTNMERETASHSEYAIKPQ